MGKWRCTVCGYIHEGEQPPAECPVCGVGPEEFALQAEENGGAAARDNEKRWKCAVCEYVYTGPQPPASCPICGVGPEQFVQLGDAATGALTAEAVSSTTAATLHAALDALSYGLYIVTSADGERINGQCANTVFQLTSKPPRIAVCLNKRNLTHEIVHNSGVLAVSILGREQGEMAKKFGYCSGRKTDKFQNIDFLPGMNGCPILKDCLGYLEAKVLPEQTVDVGTHTLFVADVTSGHCLAEAEPLTYALYREQK